MLRGIAAAKGGDFRHFALAITAIGPDQSHSGLLYVNGENKLMLLHLADNLDLRNDPPADKYKWAQTSLNLPLKKLLAVLCHKIAELNPPLHYGFDRSGIKIDPETGSVTPGPKGKGLTCASFILSIFESIGLNLLKEELWPQNANKPWQEKSLIRLKNLPNADQEHIDLLRDDIGFARFLPEEVIAASTIPMKHWPVSPSDLQSAAITIALELTR